MAVLFVNGVLKARKHERIDTLTSSTGFTSSNYDVTDGIAGNDANWKVLRAEEVVITVETADIRWTVDGSTPTVTSGTGNGHLASAGDVISITGYENIQNFKAINAVASSGAKLRVSFFFRQ
jgi:hypothetical protein